MSFKNSSLMQDVQGTRRREDGYAMITLLVAMALMAIFMSAALPAWRHASQREREAELIWRGQQYDRAVQLFRRKFSAPGPPNLDILLEQRLLRKKYKDPITGGDFELKPVGPGGLNVPPPGEQRPQQSAGPRLGASEQDGEGPGQRGRGLQPTRAEGQLIGGVRSKSKQKSIRVLNGRDRYDQWEFTYVPYNPDPKAPQLGPTQPGQQPGRPGAGRPGAPGTRPGGLGSQTPRQPSGRD
jgi:type II secretory pathway pseudopilin PulG